MCTTSAALGRFEHLLRFVAVSGERLLADHVLPGRNCFQHDCGVRMRWRRDGDGIDAVERQGVGQRRARMRDVEALRSVGGLDRVATDQRAYLEVRLPERAHMGEHPEAGPDHHGPELLAIRLTGHVRLLVEPSALSLASPQHRRETDGRTRAQGRGDHGRRQRDRSGARRGVPRRGRACGDRRRRAAGARGRAGQARRRFERSGPCRRHRRGRPPVGGGAGGGNARSLRPGRHRVQQRRRLDVQHDRPADDVGLALGARRRSLGCDPRRAHVPADHAAARDARPHREHRFDRRSGERRRAPRAVRGGEGRRGVAVGDAAYGAGGRPALRSASACCARARRTRT